MTPGFLSPMVWHRVHGKDNVRRGVPLSGDAGITPREGQMQARGLVELFVRSLTIQASFNFWRMQGLGFAFAMLPLLRPHAGDRPRVSEALARHLQSFNTHPYLTAAILGSVAKLEEQGEPEAADRLKTILMAPYAAIGDVFFWGALRSLGAVTAVLLALLGAASAPLALLLLYNPAHLWVRIRGLVEGYRRGQDAVSFIGALNLPTAAKWIRILCLILVALAAAVAVDAAGASGAWPAGVGVDAAMLAVPLLFSLALRRGLSPVVILYGAALLCMVIPI